MSIKYSSEQIPLPPEGVTEPVTVLALCEVDHVCLKPNQLYKFIVMDGCDACKAAEENSRW
jgi:hypothetical protein